MQSVVSTKGQTVIPKEVREALGIQQDSKLLWIVKDGSAVVYAMPQDPIEAAAGALKDLPISSASLLRDRQIDSQKEDDTPRKTAKRWRATS